ncbi:MAG: hypothetical protein PHX30_01040 [Candidatus Pacebacteria bacterium]|nr:hypothetical protein [Candidatus Paceibacterota bacterium]
MGKKELDERKVSIVKLHRLVSYGEVSEGHIVVRTSEEQGFVIKYLDPKGFHWGPMMEWEPITYEEFIDMVIPYMTVEDAIGGWFFNWLTVPEDYRLKIQEILQLPISDKEYAEVDEIIRKNRKDTIKNWIQLIELRIEKDNFNLARNYLEKVNFIYSAMGNNSEISRRIRGIEAKLAEINKKNIAAEERSDV